jgi:hypothetical protein
MRQVVPNPRAIVQNRHGQDGDAADVVHEAVSLTSPRAELERVLSSRSREHLQRPGSNEVAPPPQLARELDALALGERREAQPPRSERNQVAGPAPEAQLARPRARAASSNWSTSR